MGLWFRATPLPLRSFPEKRCSQILSGCYPALAGEASKVLGQNLSQPFKTKGATHVSQSPHPHRFHGSAAQTLATRTGKELTRISVATTRRYQQDSEWKEKTQWHDYVLYGATAHFAATLPKGSHVLIEGELTYREFELTVESETGAIKVQWPVTEIVVESIKTLDRKTKDSTHAEGAA
jgi:single-strand DNA-binding protein